MALTFLRCAHDTAPQTDSCCSLLTAACKYARDKKLQEKQKKLNSLPPIFRPRNKKSRQLAAVAHFQQKIRPGRFVDTDKLNRKQWATTEVALNPFLYGKKDELTMVRQSPLKTLESNDDPDESLDGAFSFPSPCRPHLEIALTSRMGDLSRPVRGNCILDKESGMEPRIKEGAMWWQRHLVSRNPRKSGPRKGSFIPRLIRRRKELHLNLKNTDILHRSYIIQSP